MRSLQLHSIFTLFCIVFGSLYGSPDPRKLDYISDILSIPTILSQYFISPSPTRSQTRSPSQAQTPSQTQTQTQTQTSSVTPSPSEPISMCCCGEMLTNCDGYMTLSALNGLNDTITIDTRSSGNYFTYADEQPDRTGTIPQFGLEYTVYLDVYPGAKMIILDTVQTPALEGYINDTVLTVIQTCPHGAQRLPDLGPVARSDDISPSNFHAGIILLNPPVGRLYVVIDGYRYLDQGLVNLRWLLEYDTTQTNIDTAGYTVIDYNLQSWIPPRKKVLPECEAVLSVTSSYPNPSTSITLSPTASQTASPTISRSMSRTPWGQKSLRISPTKTPSPSLTQSRSPSLTQSRSPSPTPSRRAH